MSMLLAYGQTGSGKTFTVSGMEKLVVDRLMDGNMSGRRDIHMCIFEVAGSNMYGALHSTHDHDFLLLLTYCAFRSSQRTKPH